MKVIKMHGFKKSYDDKDVHQDVSFYLHKGKCLGLLGGSGSGKSVILRTLIGLETPDGGSVKILGNDVSAPKIVLDPVLDPISPTFTCFVCEQKCVATFEAQKCHLKSVHSQGASEM